MRRRCCWSHHGPPRCHFFFIFLQLRNTSSPWSIFIFSIAIAITISISMSGNTIGSGNFELVGCRPLWCPNWCFNKANKFMTNEPSKHSPMPIAHFHSGWQSCVGRGACGRGAGVDPRIVDGDGRGVTVTTSRCHHWCHYELIWTIYEPISPADNCLGMCLAGDHGGR